MKTDLGSTPRLRDLNGVILADYRTSHLSSYLLRGTAGTFTLRLAATVLAFLTNILLARVLGAAEYGVYAYVFAWIGILSVFSVLGFDQLLVREVASYSAAASWGLMSGLLRWSALLVAFVSSGLAAVVAALIWFAKGLINSQMFPAIWVALLVLPLVTLNTLRGATMSGLKHVVSGMIPGVLVSSPLLIALIIAVSGFEAGSLKAGAAVGLSAIAAGAGLLFGFWLLSRVLPADIRTAIPHYRKTHWFLSALPLLAIAGLHEVNSRVVLILLGELVGAEATGLFAVAQQLAGSISFILLSVNAVLTPIIASLYASGQMHHLQRIITRSARLTVLISLPVAFSLVAFRQLILPVFGQGFEQAGPVLIVLSVGQLVNAGTGSVGILLTMTGRERIVALCIGLATLLNVVLALILIPHWQLLGAAVATVASMVFWNCTLLVQVYRRLGIDATAVGMRTRWT